MRVGRHRKYVTLANVSTTAGDSDGLMNALSPADWWCSIEPQAPLADDRTVTHLITGRWRGDITMDTRVLYADPALNRNREFFVRGFQNLSEQNAEMVLYAEEVIPG